MRQARSRSAPGRFLATVAAATLALLGLAAAVTVAVDPYDLHGMPRIEGFNALKPAAAQRGFDGKLAQARRAMPRTLLLGNSRIEAGLDPESAAWPEAMRPVFNAGLPGTGAATSLAFLSEALARGVRPGLVVVGVEFLDTVVRGADAAAEPEDRSARDPAPLSRARRWVEHTLSITALSDAVRTVAAQRIEGTDTLTPLGFNPLHSYARFARANGLHELFAIKRAEYVERVRGLVPRRFDAPETDRSFRAVIALLDLAAANGIEVVLVVYPYHAQLLDLIGEHGLWETFEAWKRALVAVAAAAEGRVRVLDFSAYAPLTMAAVPDRNDRRIDGALYWELSHFTAALGDRMIDAIAGRDSGFGVPLSPASLEAAISDQRRAARLNGGAGIP